MQDRRKLNLTFSLNSARSHQGNLEKSREEAQISGLFRSLLIDKWARQRPGQLFSHLTLYIIMHNYI